MIATDLLLLHLWVRPSHHHYYFGDYYHADFVRAGFSPWYDVHAHHHGYDPMLAHYRWDHSRRGIDVVSRLQKLARVLREEARPASAARHARHALHGADMHRDVTDTSEDQAGRAGERR